MGVDAINMDIGNQKSETCSVPPGAGLRHGESHSANSGVARQETRRILGRILVVLGVGQWYWD